MTSDHPPRPRLTVNIGITGHRGLPEGAAEAVEVALDRVLGAFRSAAERLALDEGSPFAPGEPCLLLHTPLAAGVDQIAAPIARAHRFSVRALLPFGASEYQSDFAPGSERVAFLSQLEQAESCLALPGARDREHEAYLLVGQAVVAVSDIVVAIWDGEAAQGPGGTADVVELALRSRVPVIHVVLDRERGTISDTRLLTGEARAAARSLDEADAFEQLLRECLMPSDAAMRGHLAQFFAARQVSRCWRIEYKLLLAMLGVKSLGAVPWRQAGVADDIASEWSCAREHGLTGQDELERAYGWANTLAIRYALLFRSSHVANYALSAIAVWLALVGLILPGAKLGFVLGELVAIGLLIANTRAGNRGDWHRRWLQYRHLAESLRPLPYLRETALAGPPFRGQWVEGPLKRRSGTDWTHWYAAAIWRMMHPPSGVLDESRIERLSRAATVCLIEPQATYHEKNAPQMHELDHALHRIGNTLLAAVIVVCCLFVLGYFAVPESTRANNALFVMLTAGLPAIGAAVFGLRGHGEHLLAARRSARSAAHLRACAQALEGAARPQVLADGLESVAAVMLADLDEWTVTYQTRALEIPA